MEVIEQELEQTTGIFVGSGEITSREVASNYEQDLANADLIRMSVKAFAWEVNRNGFQIKKKVLKKNVVDAFGDKLPMYRTFEGKLVDRNHKMIDNGSKKDEAIGFIEGASMKEDGVYLDLWIWKRCITDEEQRQIRASEVAVSMEVNFTKPVVIVDGMEVPNTPENRRLKGAVRSMADDSIVNFLGIAVLFDGIVPGYASASVVATENAVLDVIQEPAEDTVPPNSMRGCEAASVQSQPPLEENYMEIKELEAKLAERDSELAAANDALAAKQADLQKAYEDLEALRTAQWNATVSAAFDLGKLTPDTCGWLLDMLRWSGDVESVCARIAEIAVAVKAPGVPALDDDNLSTGSDCPDGDCGECAACKAKAELASADPSVVVEDASSVNVAVDTPAAVEPVALTAPVGDPNPQDDPEGDSDTGKATAALVNIAAPTTTVTLDTAKPQWGISAL